jgi:hypothetical protein
MALLAAVALTLVSPGIMKAIIPANSYARWDRPQYITHLTALVMLWWTLTLAALAFAGRHLRLRRALGSYGFAAMVVSALAVLFLVLRQAPALILHATGMGSYGLGLFYSRVFDILEHAPDAVGASIAAAWTVLAVTRTGRWSSNWFERLGCILGWAWIVIGLLVPFVWGHPIDWLKWSGIPW